MIVEGKSMRTLWWEARPWPMQGAVHMIDQRLLPWSLEILCFTSPEEVAEAIRNMTVRGAGAIGVAGAFGMALAFCRAVVERRNEGIEAARVLLAGTRPTAQNLFYGIREVLEAGAPWIQQDLEAARDAAVARACALADADAEACRRIGTLGMELLPQRARVSTHCNAGWLAFVDWGSALSPVYSAVRAGKDVFVYVDETRPRGQGARLTAWELVQEGIEHAVITDGGVASELRRGRVDVVLVGADRIAANGDVANKVGTYPLALAARAAGVPFYVAAPASTFAPLTPDGDAIPIEARAQDEVLYVEGPDDAGILRRVRVVAPGATAMNPAFDVTPAALITGIITEHGIHAASREGLAGLGASGRSV